jgi:tetratricopeptide (TPR) repeat protein
VGKVKSLKIVVTLVGCTVALALTVWFIWYFSRADVSEFHLKVSPKEFKVDLITRENHIKQEISQEQDPQKKAEKQKELQVAQKRIENPDQALKEYEEKTAAAYKALEGFKEEIGKRSLAKAKEALEKGDTSLAERLFQGVFDRGSIAQKAEAAFQLGSLAESHIDYLQAQDYYRKAVGLQPDNPQYLNAAGLMALTMGYYQEAEPLFRGALNIREKVSGPEHPDVASSLNNLAELYRTQGKYGEAEPLYKRSLAIWEKALGPEHPDLATSLNNLAELYRTQGKYGEAEPLYKRSLAILEKALGPEHPDVASILNNLAELYRTQGKYGEAEPLYKRSLAILEKALGPEHPNVGASLNNLALLYKTQGKYEEAEPLYRRALAIKEKSLGPEHPDMAISLENYAALLREMGRGAEAEPLESRARAIRARHAEKNPPKQD